MAAFSSGASTDAEQLALFAEQVDSPVVQLRCLGHQHSLIDLADFVGTIA